MQPQLRRVLSTVELHNFHLYICLFVMRQNTYQDIHMFLTPLSALQTQARTRHSHTRSSETMSAYWCQKSWLAQILGLLITDNWEQEIYNFCQLRQILTRR